MVPDDEDKLTFWGDAYKPPGRETDVEIPALRRSGTSSRELAAPGVGVAKDFHWLGSSGFRP